MEGDRMVGAISSAVLLSAYLLALVACRQEWRERRLLVWNAYRERENVVAAIWLGVFGVSYPLGYLHNWITNQGTNKARVAIWTLAWVPVDVVVLYLLSTVPS